MSGYIGTAPVPQATQTRDSFTATSGQTSFATGGYTPNFLDVYLNGVKLASADYTASNGSDVVLASGAATGDILEVVAFTTFNSASSSIDDNGNATAITIDSSERLLIGKTDTTFNTAGNVFYGDGSSDHTRNGLLLQLNRTTTDGEHIRLLKDGSSVGSIGVNSGDQVYFAASDGMGIKVDTDNTSVEASNASGADNDNAVNLGSSGTRWKDLYLSGGVNIYNSSTDAVDIRGTGSRCEIDNPANNSILLKTGGTTRVRIDSNGLLFGSDTASANALGDYEEGTWTPIITGGSGTKTAGTGNHGSYTKIGNMVTLVGTVVWNGTQSIGTYPRIGNFPFNSINTADRRSGCVIGANTGVNANSGYESIIAVCDPNGNHAWIIQQRDDLGGYSHNPTIKNSGAFLGFSVCYMTDA